MEKILIAVFAVLVSLPIIFLHAFTISALWGWFVVPLGVKAISYVHAYGLALLVSVFMGKLSSGGKDSPKDFIIKAILINVFALLFGYIAVQFI